MISPHHFHPTKGVSPSDSHKGGRWEVIGNAQGEG